MCAAALPKSMSARNVWRGTLPSLYHSLLPISAPPSLPEHSTLTPSAPAFNAAVTALFIALLKATLFSN